MTTGRINQVANPSSTRGEQARPKRTDSAGPGTLGRRTLGRDSPRNSRGALLRGAGPDPGSLTDVGMGGAPGGARSDVVGRLGPGTLPSALQRGRRGGAWDARSRRTPLWHTFLRAYSVLLGTFPSRLWTRPRTSCLERAVRRTGHRVPYWWGPFGR